MSVSWSAVLAICTVKLQHCHQVQIWICQDCKYYYLLPNNDGNCLFLLYSWLFSQPAGYVNMRMCMGVHISCQNIWVMNPLCYQSQKEKKRGRPTGLPTCTPRTHTDTHVCWLRPTVPNRISLTVFQTHTVEQACQCRWCRSIVKNRQGM